MNDRSSRRAAVLCMSPLDAARLTAEDYPGGVPAMALRLGKSWESLRKEMSPPDGSTAKLGLLDALRMMTRSGDYRIADAIEAELGRFALPLPVLDNAVPNDALADHFVHISKEFGEVLQETAVRAADGDISDNDVAAVEEQWGQLMAAGSAMLKHLVALNAQRRPGGAA